MGKGKGGRGKGSRTIWSGSPAPSARPRRSDNQPNYYEGNSDSNEDGNTVTTTPRMVNQTSPPNLVTLEEIHHIVKASEERLKNHIDSKISDVNGRVQKVENNIDELNAKINEVKLDAKNQINEVKLQHELQIERLKSDFEEYKRETQKQLIDMEEQCNQKVMKAQKKVKRIHDFEASKISASVVLSGTGLTSYTDGENATEVAMNAIKNHLKLNLREGDIRSAYRLGDPKKNEKANMVLQVNHEGVKINLISGSRKMKCKDLSANEHLSKSTANLVRRLRKVKSQNPNSLASVFTRDGIIYVKKTDHHKADKSKNNKKTSDGELSIIRDEDDLTEFLSLNNLEEKIENSENTKK